MKYFLAGILIISATILFTDCSNPSNLEYIYPDSTTTIKYQDDWKRGEFHKRIKEFKKNPIGFDKIVFFGNSITYGLRHWDNKFQTDNLVNRGISGDFTEGILKRLDEIIYYKPVSVFILIGLNDFFGDNTSRPEITAPYVVTNILEAARTIKKGTPKTKIYLQTILPINNQQYLDQLTMDRRKNYYFLKSDFLPSINRLINETNKLLLNNNEFRVIDLHPLYLNNDKEMKKSLSKDGIHLNEDGYSVWIGKIKPLIENLNKEAN